MAFIVKGLNMPTCCDMCEFCIQDFDNLVAFCSASNIYWNNISDVPYDKCHPACPLIEVPKEAVLIDKNKIKERMMPLDFSVQKWISEVDLDLYVPTIFEEKNK